MKAYLLHLHKTYGPAFLKTKEKEHQGWALPACLPACVSAAGSWAPINASIHLGSGLSQKSALGLRPCSPVDLDRCCWHVRRANAFGFRVRHFSSIDFPGPDRSRKFSVSISKTSEQWTSGNVRKKGCT